MYLSTKEVASMFNVTEGTIRNWANAGILKCERSFFGTHGFLKEDIEPVLEVWNEYNRVFKVKGPY